MSCAEFARTSVTIGIAERRIRQERIRRRPGQPPHAVVGKCVRARRIVHLQNLAHQVIRVRRSCGTLSSIHAGMMRHNHSRRVSAVLLHVHRETEKADDDECPLGRLFIAG